MNSEHESQLTEVTQGQLAEILEDVSLQDIDPVGSLIPHTNNGQRGLIYFAIGTASFLSNTTWMAMGLVYWPVAVTLFSGGMACHYLAKSLNSKKTTFDTESYGNSAQFRQTVNTTATTVQATSAGNVGTNTQLTAVDTTAEVVSPVRVHNDDQNSDTPSFVSNPFVGAPGQHRQAVGPSNTDGIDLDKVQSVLTQRAAVEAGMSLEDYKAQRMQAELGEIVDDSSIDIVVTPVEQAPQPMDIAKYMAVNLRPTLISAVPRSGKGIVVAQLWREFKQMHPYGIVWVIQPKPHPLEAGYWDGVDRFWGEMIEGALGKPKEIKRISEELTNFIDQWRRQPQRPKMLIIDEGVKLQSVLPKWYNDYLKPTVQVEASSGETDDRYLYIVSQSPLATDVGISTGNRASLEFLHIHKPGAEECLGIMRKSFNSVPEPDAELHQHSTSPKTAIFYHTGLSEWHPMPAYPVYQKALTASGSSTVSANSFPFTPQFEQPSQGGNSSIPAWDFEDGLTSDTPNLDAKILEFQEYANEPRYQCVVEFLQSLKEHEKTTDLTPSDFSRSTWASRWVGKEGGLVDRKGDAMNVFLRNGVKLGFLKAENNKYEITLN